MKDFDFYQVIGVISPGVIVVTGGIVLFFPEQRQNLESISNLSIGGLGLGLILAYALGQLLQAFGSIIEKIWWKFWGGMPIDWVRSGKRDLVAESQRKQIQRHAQTMLNDQSLDFTSIDAKQWYSIVRQMYAAVSIEARASRIDVFNANYGLCRGVVASFLALFAATVIKDWQLWILELVLVILIALSIFRMHRFGVHYARELFIQFLDSQDKRIGGDK